MADVVVNIAEAVAVAAQVPPNRIGPLWKWERWTLGISAFCLWAVATWMICCIPNDDCELVKFLNSHNFLKLASRTPLALLFCAWVYLCEQNPLPPAIPPRVKVGMTAFFASFSLLGCVKVTDMWGFSIVTTLSFFTIPFIRLFYAVDDVGFLECSTGMGASALTVVMGPTKVYTWVVVFLYVYGMLEAKYEAAQFIVRRERVIRDRMARNPHMRRPPPPPVRRFSTGRLSSFCMGIVLARTVSLFI